MKTNGRRIFILGLTLIVLIGLLAAGLQTIEFRGGQPLPDLGEPEMGGPGVLPFPYAFMERLLELMPWVILGIIILAIIIFRKKILKEFTWRIIISCLIILGLFGLFQLIEPLTENNEEDLINNGGPWQPPWGQPWEPDPNGEPTDPPDELAELPWWSSYIIAAMLATLLVWLIWRLIRKISQKYEATPPDKELREAAIQATDELRAGLPAEEVVIRCWTKMAEILTKRTPKENEPAVTPRELAQILAKWGMRDQAITELTQLFEEVRYGAKADASRRNRALAALTTIEKAYSQKESAETNKKTSYF